MALAKADIAKRLFEVMEELNKREAKYLVNEFFEAIRGTLERGEIVKLSGFGNFNLRDKKARPGRNPKTGESVLIQSRRVVTFHAGHKLKNRVGNYDRTSQD